MQLRCYQQECLDTILAKYASGICRQLVSLPTGSGKTVILASLIKKMKRPALVLAHTLELIDQTRRKIEEICPSLNVGVVTGQGHDYSGDVIVSTIQSAKSPQILEKLVSFAPELVIVDEAHHAASESWNAVISKLMKPVGQRQLGIDGHQGTLLCGFSATVLRSDGKGLGGMFDELVYSKSIDWMVQHGYLCRARGVKVQIPIDWNQVEITKDGADYNERSLYNMMNTPQVLGIIVDTYLAHCKDRKTILFGVTIDHATTISNALKAQGIVSDVVHGAMSTSDRECAIGRYKSGATAVLCNCQVLTEGFDDPETDCVFVAKPTKAQGSYVQMLGRGLRRHPGKDHCLVVDLCDETHSLTTVDIILPSITAEETALKKRKKDSTDYAGTKVNRKMNGELRSVLYEYVPVGNRFFWERAGEQWQLKGLTSSITISKDTTEEKSDRYILQIIVRNQDSASREIRYYDDFDTAFAEAEDHARLWYKDFVLVDSLASWLDDHATDKQLKMIAGYGYKGTGMQGLTKGQARILINHLMKTKTRRTMPQWLKNKIANNKKTRV